MFLKDFTTSDERKIAKINKALKEAFGFTLASNIESGKLQSLYTKVADDLYNLKLDLGTVKDKDYAKKLLVKEGLGLLLKSHKLDESLLAGPGANAYARVIKWLSEFVESACEVGDEYEEAVYDAMKHYRSSKYRFNDAMVEQDLRSATAACLGEPEALSPALPAGMDPMDSVAPADFDMVRESAPPGMEDTVMKLKKQYPGEEEKAFATAWSIYNKKKGKSPKKEGCDMPVKEDSGHSILDIITPEELERLRGYVAGNGDLYEDDELFDKLFTYYVNSGEMPYGVAKARDGDPDVWILDQVQADYSDEVLGMEEAGRNPDRYADREWAQQLSQEAGERDEIIRKLGGGKPKVTQRDPEGEDYFSYMSKKKTREATEMKEGYVKKLRALLEAEVEQAESIIAAKGFSQELQDMVEKLGRLVNEDLPAVTDQMRDAYGADIATGFENAVGQTLSGVMDSLKTSKQEVDKAVDSIASGGTPNAASDMEAPEVNDLDAEGGDELDLGDADLDIGDDLGLGDEFGGADAAAGEDELLGRAKKESVSRAAQLSRKILETKAKIAKAKKKAKK